MVLNEIQALAATNIEETSFTANWTSSAGATEYLLDVAADEAFTNLIIDDQSVTGESFDITDLTPGQFGQLFYRVQAKNGDIITPYSNVIRVPLSIVALPATNIETASFTANWEALSDAADWLEVETSQNDFTTIATVNSPIPVSDISLNFTDLDEGRYQYRIRSVTVDNGDTIYSPYSNIITVATKPVAPTILTVITSAAGTTPSVELNWTVNTTNTSSFQWIERTIAGTDNWTPLLNASDEPIQLAISESSYTDNSVSSGIIYNYRVVAIVPDYQDVSNTDLFIRCESSVATTDIVSAIEK